MVSISFGKSNFSEAQNSYQMTIALIMMVLVLCAISSVTTLIVTNKSDSPEKKKDEVKKEKEDEVVVKNAVEELESIKDRIKQTEKYREYYRSETNNGITVVGTLMEQMIDVMIAILKQPLVKEVVSKHITEKQDAIEIAEYIELLGKEVVKEVEQTQLLRCGREMVETCDTYTYPDGEEIQQCSMVEGDGDAPVNNCDYYVENHKEIEKGMERAMINLYNKTLSILEKSEEKDKIYRISKNLAKANRKQYMLSSGMKIDDQYMNDYFPEQSYMENVAMAHYKYLGKELSTTLGDSIIVRELTDDEKPFISYRTSPQNDVHSSQPLEAVASDDVTADVTSIYPDDVTVDDTPIHIGETDIPVDESA